MADKKISQLTETTTAGSNDELALVQSGVTKKIKAGNLHSSIGVVIGNSVSDYASLPAAASYTGELWYVQTSTGFLWNRRAGWYISTGSTWNRASNQTLNVQDNELVFKDDGDTTKELVIQLSGITTGTQRTLTMADADVDLADIATNTTAIGLNTTHRGLVSGNPHVVTKSEVGLGNVPNTDCTDADNIADGATNAIISLTQESNYDAASAHVSANGASHTFIDQSVVSGSSPAFIGTNISGVNADTFDTLNSTAFAILAGQAGGQTLNGGTASGDDLTLQSTSNATKGDIILGTKAKYDELNNRLIINDNLDSTTDLGAIHLKHTQQTGINNYGIVIEDSNAATTGRKWQIYVDAGSDFTIRNMDDDGGNSAKIIESSVSGTAGVTMFNSLQYDIDNQFMGITNANLLHLDAGLDAVGIGIAASSQHRLTIEGDVRMVSGGGDVSELAFYNTAADLGNGTWLGRIEFGGLDGGVNRRAIQIIASTNEAWSTGNQGTKLIFRTTENGTTTVSDNLIIGDDGGIHAPNMKSGLNQSDAGAAAGELYYDTNDGNTVKMGV